MPKVCISLQYLQQSMGDEVDFLPGYKHKSLLQVDRITSGVHIQAYPTCPKQQVYNIFVIYQRKHEGWSWFFLSLSK